MDHGFELLYRYHDADQTASVLKNFSEDDAHDRSSLESNSRFDGIVALLVYLGLILCSPIVRSGNK